MEELPTPRTTSPAVIRWGTAHLAWGCAIFAGLIFAAQQTPLDSTPKHERLCTATFFAGLISVALLGWVQVDRGWKLRRPGALRVRLRLIELLGNLAVVAATWHALGRGVSSRLLTLGLDRLAVTALLSSGISALLLVTLECVLWRTNFRQPAKTEEHEPDYAIPYWLVASQVIFVALLEWLEMQAW